MNFKIWLFETRYIGPDEFLGDAGAVTFTFVNNKLYYGAEPKIVTHPDLVKLHPELIKRYNFKRTDPDALYTDNNQFSKDLSGRVGMDVIEWQGKTKKRKVAAFWNSEPEQYNEFDNCIKALVSNRILDNNSFISTPFGTAPITEIDQHYQAAMKRLDQDKLDQIELAKKMHTMTGQAKKSAMKQLGVGYSSSPKGWHHYGQKAGIYVPGQKWWAPTSEATILEAPSAYRNALGCPYWGDAGSGMLVVAKDSGKILLNHRGGGAVESGTYGVFGGGIFLHQVGVNSTEELAKTDIPQKNAIKELQEETSYHGPISNVQQIHTFKDNKVNRDGTPCNFYYWTFLGIVPTEFPVKVGYGFEDEEGGNSGWFTLEEAKNITPKHPGLVDLFRHAWAKIAQVAR